MGVWSASRPHTSEPQFNIDWICVSNSLKNIDGDLSPSDHSNLKIQLTPFLARCDMFSAWEKESRVEKYIPKYLYIFTISIGVSISISIFHAELYVRHFEIQRFWICPCLQKAKAVCSIKKDIELVL